MNTMFTDKLRIKELEESLASSTALLAMVGAGDLAVEKIRNAREELMHRSVSFDAKVFRERVAALQTEMQSAPGQIKALPEKAQALPEKAQEWPAKAQEWPAKAQALFADLVSTAFSTYGDLAGRGKTVVTSVRGETVVEHAEPISRPTTEAKTTAAKTATKKSAVKKPAGKKPAAKSSATDKTTTADKPAAAKTSTTDVPAKSTTTDEPAPKTTATDKPAAKTTGTDSQA